MRRIAPNVRRKLDKNEVHLFSGFISETLAGSYLELNSEQQIHEEKPSSVSMLLTKPELQSVVECAIMLQTQTH